MANGEAKRVQDANHPGDIAAMLASERARLVGLCAHLTGDAAVAEDLAQETCLEAWRHMHKQRDPTVRASWLSGIARNVCLRWARSRGRALHGLADRRSGDILAEPDLCEEPATDVGLEVELERDELARLLDRALALLPPATRRVLIESYVHESPQAEVAARLGVSEGAVAMRLRRGKLALRRVLTYERRSDTASYSISVPGLDGWQETSLWCSVCGQRRLVGRVTRAPITLTLRCPVCCRDPGVNHTQGAVAARPDGSISYPAAQARLSAAAHRYFRRGLAERMAPCAVCGHPTTVRLALPPGASTLPPDDGHGIHVYCAACGALSWTTLAGLALCLPESQHFWREHRRIRTLPPRSVEVAGRAALVTRFESIAGRVALDVIHARETYEVLAVHGTPRPAALRAEGTGGATSRA